MKEQYMSPDEFRLKIKKSINARGKELESELEQEKLDY